MTEQQRKGIEILNDLKAERYEDGTHVISDDDYFFLLSFIIERPQEVQYVPQIVPTLWPISPAPLQPYYGTPQEQRWEITCKTD